MDNESDLNRSQSQRTTLAAFAKTLQLESHVLKNRPDLLWQQMYNRLQWDEESLQSKLETEKRRRIENQAPAWMRVCIQAPEFWLITHDTFWPFCCCKILRNQSRWALDRFCRRWGDPALGSRNRRRDAHVAG